MADLQEYLDKRGITPGQMDEARRDTQAKIDAHVKIDRHAKTAARAQAETADRI